MTEDELVQRLRRWMDGGEAPPYIVEAKLTLRCNLKCSFCDAGQIPKNRYKEIEDEEISMDDWLRLVNDAGELGVRKFVITGGEPLIKSGVIEMMYRIKKYRMEGTLWTNATLFTKSQIEDLVSMEWDRIVVGLDGSTQEIHDELRGAASFNRLKNNIEKINLLKQELNKNKPFTQVFFLLCRKNYFDVPNLVQLAKKLNFNSIHIKMLEPFSSNSNELCIRPTETERVCNCLREAKKTADELDITTIFPILETINEEKEVTEKGKTKNDSEICFRPWYMIHINEQGYVDACSRLNRASHHIIQRSWKRNLPRENFVSNNLKEIWYRGEYFKRIRELIINENFPECCKKLCNKSEADFEENVRLKARLQNLESK